MSSKDQKARESFASILSYYEKNRGSIENWPGWVDEAKRASITLVLNSKDVDSDQKTEEFKKELAKLLSTQDMLNKLTPEEKDLMTRAANSSKIRRKGNGKD